MSNDDGWPFSLNVSSQREINNEAKIVLNDEYLVIQSEFSLSTETNLLQGMQRPISSGVVRYSRKCRYYGKST
jgi:hypothetical protein